MITEYQHPQFEDENVRQLYSCMHVERRAAFNTLGALFEVVVKLFFMTKKQIYRRFFLPHAINDSLSIALSPIKFASLIVNGLMSYSYPRLKHPAWPRLSSRRV